MNVLVSLISDTLVYAGLPLGLWISFRILGYPDLAIEQLFVLGSVLYAVTVSAKAAPLAGISVLMVVAIILGAFCSYIRVRFAVHPVLISLAMSYGYYSLSLVLLGGPNTYLTSTRPDTYTVLTVAALFLSLAILMLQASSGTRVGLRVIAAGSNIGLATRYGMKPVMSQAVGLAVSFALILGSGWLYAWRSGFVDVTSGTGFLLIAVFVVVLGRALQRRVNIARNTAVLVALLIVYLELLDIALRAGLPPQWLRGANAAALLMLVLALPKDRSRTLAV